MPANPLLETAIDYLMCGYSVIPAHTVRDGVCSCGKDDCSAPGKHPRIAWAAYQEQRAVESQLRDWWQRWPTANIAVITGAISGIVVLDIDHHGAINGEESLRDLGQIPDTPTARTGGGGTHFIFSHPGETVPNAAGLLPGVDVRGDGGYIIAPPSLHASGRSYTWALDPRDLPLAPIPDWLLPLLRGGKRGGNGGGNGGKDPLDLEQYISGHATIPLGSRNVILTRIAGHYLGRSTGVEETIALLSVVYAARCEPDESGEGVGLSEITTLVESIAGREHRQREAIAQLGTEASVLGEDDLLEAARGLWSGLGIKAIAGWSAHHSGDQIAYILELPEDEANLGDSLIDQQRIRKILLNKGKALFSTRKREEWDIAATALRACARDVYSGPRSTAEEVGMWVLDWLSATKRGVWIEVDATARRDWLNEGPCLTQGRPTLRLQPFWSFLRQHHGERMTVHMLRQSLRRSLWVPRDLRVGDGKVNVWCGPSCLTDGITEPE